MTMKRVRLLTEFLGYPKWASPSLPDGQADAVVAGGRAEWFPAEEPAGVPEQAQDGEVAAEEEGDLGGPDAPGDPATDAGPADPPDGEPATASSAPGDSAAGASPTDLTRLPDPTHPPSRTRPSRRN